ncbi:MAG: ferrous iron transport protein B [Clostridium sp.]|jgi:ferrous iron transport protein B|nr:ferrous iron transport protein B [Clostridium sp.]
MAIKIALAGNPNSGKTTLFNALTGSNQFVGNWPGVTVEKKEGKLKGHKDVTVTDLPGIYSLSPYTLEEVVARNYLLDERPDVILNIIDGTNLERNLFLTTQLTEMGIPVVLAINMMDVVQKSGDKINTQALSKVTGCPVAEISALKGEGIKKAAEMAVEAGEWAAKIRRFREENDGGEPPEGMDEHHHVHRLMPKHSFSGGVEHTLAHIEERVLHDLPQEQQRFYAIKLFERDENIIEKLGLTSEQLAHIEDDITRREEEMDDDSESIMTAERYTYIDSIIKDCVKIKNKGKLTISDKIDKVVTNRFLALPIFALVMFIVYYISVTTVGAFVTDWTNDGLFGDGFHITGGAAYEQAVGEYDDARTQIEAYLGAAEEKGIDTSAISAALEAEEPDEGAEKEFISKAQAAGLTAQAELLDEDGELSETVVVDANSFENALTVGEPDPADYGTWVPGVPALMERGLDAVGCADWLKGLILDGIVAGVGAVLGFVPQMFILFMFLAFLEACGYMARIAFIMDRIFRRFGLSGKSFIPILIGTGCGVPGIMASRTIESDRDRKMTIMTTTFIPCSAKLPIIALIAGACFNNAGWVAASAYFVGMAAIICSGILLKKTKLFSGDVAPFVMELPAYHWPTVGNILRSMWERGWSFIKKAGTIILLATVFVWFLSSFGWQDGSFGMVGMSESLLARIGGVIAPIFNPLGWGDWKSAVAAITGLIAKENVVGTFGILYNPALSEVAEDGAEIWGLLKAAMPPLAAYSFLLFNLLCAPCFAAMGAIKREMNSAKWFWIAIGYQCLFAYAVALCVYQLGMLIGAGSFGAATVAAVLLVIAFGYLLLRRERKAGLGRKHS